MSDEPFLLFKPCYPWPGEALHGVVIAVEGERLHVQCADGTRFMTPSWGFDLDAKVPRRRSAPRANAQAPMGQRQGKAIVLRFVGPSRPAIG